MVNRSGPLGSDVHRQVIRPGQQDDIQLHEHDASEISGVFGFLRALKAVLNGSLRVDSGGSISVGGAVPEGASSQVFIHNTLQHLALLETDAGDYPNKIFILDINSGAGRLLWGDFDGGPTFTEALRVYEPDHATQASDIEVLDSSGAVTARWDDSAGGWFYSTFAVYDDSVFAPSFRTRLGPDTGDFFLFTQAESGDDTVTIQQWHGTGS